MPVHRLQQAAGAVHLLRGVGGLGHAVGIHKERAALFQRELIVPVRDAVHPAQHKAVSVFHQLVVAVRRSDDRIFMPGVGGNDLPGRDLQHAEPGGDEHLLVIALADGGIGPLQHFCRRDAHLRKVLQQDFGHHHEERRGHTLARDVGNHETEVVLVNQEEVVEVAADLFRRVHGGVDVKLRPVGEGRIDVRQHVRLDLPG